MDEAKPVHRGADHLREQKPGGGGGMPQARHYRSMPGSEVRGMSVSNAKRLKQLEDENAKLKKLLAEATLDNAVLKDITSRK
jgi:hypothetical protein